MSSSFACPSGSFATVGFRIIWKSRKTNRAIVASARKRIGLGVPTAMMENCLSLTGSSHASNANVFSPPQNRGCKFHVLA